MYDRIVVPLDGSELAEQVLPFATRISLGLGIPIHLVRVFHSVPEELADPTHSLYSSAITSGVKDGIDDYLNGVNGHPPPTT
ncbi:MAG: universal stress protein [Chloroflexi bacterium]|nr:universal stress protein [Chloroflexota bacterium]